MEEVFLNDFLIESVTVGWFVVIDIIIDATMADLISSLDDSVNVVGDFINLTIGGADGLEGFLHFGFKPTI